jgi:hypothetical protein
MQQERTIAQTGSRRQDRSPDGYVPRPPRDHRPAVAPCGLIIEIHEATIAARTLWSVVAFRDGNAKPVGQYDSLQDALAARDSHRG